MSCDHVAAVFVANPAERDKLLAGLQRAGIQAIEVHSTDQLYRVLNEQRIDAVVLEQDLGSFLTGIEILERLREELFRPVMVLAGSVSPDVRERAYRLKIDHFIPWDRDLTGACEVIKAALSVTARCGPPVPAGARRLVQNADYIRPMPQLVVKIADYLSDENASLTALAHDVSSDARVTADLLRLVNSTSFGVRHKILKPQEAVSILGIRRTAALVVAASINDVHAGMRKTHSDSVREWFRTRSLLTACTAAAFARAFRGVSPELAQTVGLLQDLGILVLIHEEGARYLKMLERCRALPLFRLDACERQEFGFTHAEVSSALLQRWELPVSLSNLVRFHHDDGGTHELKPMEKQVVAVLRLGEMLAEMRDSPSPQRSMQFMKLLQAHEETDRANVKSCMADAIYMASELGALFNVPVPQGAQWDALVERIVRDLTLRTPAPPVEAREPGAAADGAVRAAQTPQGRRTLLVVDDEAAVVRLIRIFLQDEPVQVAHWASVPENAVIGPDVVGIVCDVHLAGQDGIEFVERLRAQGDERPVIMLTGDRSRSTVETSIRAGISDFIVKPFTRAQLIDRLRKHGLLPSCLPAEDSGKAAPVPFTLPARMR